MSQHHCLRIWVTESQLGHKSTNGFQASLSQSCHGGREIGLSKLFTVTYLIGLSFPMLGSADLILNSSSERMLCFGPRCESKPEPLCTGVAVATEVSRLGVARRRPAAIVDEEVHTVVGIG
jgi:hypothetical protein